MRVEELEAALRRKLVGRVVGLRVLLDQDRVVLRGRASSYYAKQLAQHAALAMIRQLVLVNEIEVRIDPVAETD
jgi:hypothetical protein